MSHPSSHDWVEPLEYVTPQDLNPRPGILTAVGVMSIIVAGLSFLASLVGGFGAVAMLMMSSITMPAMPATFPTSRQTTVTAETEGFDEDTIDGIIEVCDRRRALSEERIAHLKQLMAESGQRIFPVPGGGLPTANYVDNNITSAGGSGGSVYYVVGTGRIEVTDDAAMFRPRRSGELITVSAGNSRSGGTTSPRQGPVIRPPTTMPNPFAGVSSSAAVLTLVENVLSAALAIYLLVIGIMVLRDSRPGGRLHWIYVIIKLPLIVVATVATVWLYSGMMKGFNAAMQSSMPPGSAPPAAWSMLVWPIFSAAVSAAYPIALMIVLSSRSVRQFYSPVMAR